ncbi:MAG TPA: TIGR03118 family protein [Solirubrobacter sp.]|nr:TIGR03118 family protein [Solirubrobacter sp.]
MQARLLLVTTAASLALASTAAAAPSDQYAVRNMVSNNTAIVPAERADPLLVNPWGLAASATSPWWPANEGSNTSTITPATNVPNPTRANVPGGPTGIVAGAGGTNFAIPGPPAGSSNFIFATLAGEIRGWRGGIPNNDSQLGISRANAGAVYTGLAIATVGGAPRLYAADLRNNRVDMVNAQWQLIDAPGAFVDPNLPAGYGAYGIQTVGNRIIVTYARQPAAGATPYREIPGAGLGVVNAFDLNGNFLARVAGPGGVLNAPWGTALAHPNFGRYGGDLLIGNFGDGRINAFHEKADGTWTHSGTLRGTDGNPLFIGGLWALQFGRGAAGNGSVDHLFFTAGPNGETAGLFGRITANPSTVTSTVSGTVAPTLSLTMGPSAAFGSFLPAVTDVYNASTTATVTATSLGATLSVADPSTFATGHLVNGEFSLAQPLQISAASAAGTGGEFTGIGGTSNPTNVLTYTGPVSNDTVTLNFRQPIAVTDPLRTGPYSKTLTFTLSTTTP